MTYNDLSLNEIEALNIFDPNRYNKVQLLNMIRNFFLKYDYLKF